MSEKGGFFKCCMIGGCLAVILGGAAVGGLTYMGSKAFMMDPAAIQASLAEGLPGATVPNGYKGLMGMKIPSVMRVSIVGPVDHTMETKSADVPLLIAAVQMPPQTSPSDLKDQAEIQLANLLPGPFVAAEQKDVQLPVGGTPQTFTEVAGACAGTNMKQIYGVVPGATGNAMLMFLGNAEKFDAAAVTAFLGSLQAAAAPPAAGDAAAPPAEDAGDAPAPDEGDASTDDGDDAAAPPAEDAGDAPASDEGDASTDDGDEPQ